MTWWTARNLWKVGIPVLVLAAIVAFSWIRRSREKQPPRIVVILPSAINPYWIEVRRGAEEEANELGARAQVHIESSQSMDAADQTALLNSFLSRQLADALVLGPASDTDTVPTVAKYSDAGKPVVVIDTELNPKEVASHHVNIAAFIGSDNIDGGRKAGAVMLEALKNVKSPRVLLLEGLPVHQSALDRAQGFREAIGKRAQIVAVNGEWSRDKAQELVASKFSREHFDGIFGSNDEMALGAITALKARNTPRAEWPIIVGFDATPDGLKALASGDMYATIAQDARGLGKRGVEDAFKALSHDPSLVPKEMLAVIVRKQ